LKKVFDAYCGICLNSRSTDMHGEYKIPEYGLSDDLDLIPESLRKYVAPLLEKFGLGREAYAMVRINKADLSSYVKA